MKNLKTSQAGHQGGSHIEVEEKIAPECLSLEGTHQRGHLKGRTQEPEYVLKWTRHVTPLPRPGPAENLLGSAAELHYFQGVGGTGPPPFFQGVGGTGPPPFFHGVGGTGPPPFAIMTEPSPWVTTTVFKLIAPTKTNMAKNTTVSLRDIMPPREIKSRGHSIC